MQLLEAALKVCLMESKKNLTVVLLVSEELLANEGDALDEKNSNIKILPYSFADVSNSSFPDDVLRVIAPFDVVVLATDTPLSSRTTFIWAVLKSLSSKTVRICYDRKNSVPFRLQEFYASQRCVYSTKKVSVSVLINSLLK
jgi:hypothetical protein